MGKRAGEKAARAIRQGVLTCEGGRPVLVSGRERMILPGPFWEGWTAMLAREVVYFPAADLQPPCPVILPAEEQADSDDEVEILFLHRLRGQLASLFGHIAIVVRGRVWNFSAVLAENEVLTVDEFYWRPCLPPFLPEEEGCLTVLEGVDPDSVSVRTEGGQQEETTCPDNRSAKKGGLRVDRYGRRFMRSLDRIKISGLSPAQLSNLEKSLTELMERVYKAAPSSCRGESPYFSAWKMNCAGFVREAFALAGLANFQSHFPRDLFIEIGWHFIRQARQAGSSLRVKYGQRIPQFPVPGIRASSSAVPLLNPASWWRALRMR